MPPKRRRPTDETEKSGKAKDRDPLGKLLKEYQVTLGALIVVCGPIFAIGGGCIGYALTRDPMSLGFLIFGGVAVLCSAVLLFLNIFNIGRGLELRKRGIRFQEAGEVTELGWGDIVDIEVRRRDETNYGVATTVKHSDDGVSPSGLLTKTEWHITIHGADGETIQLTPTFLRMVDKPQELVSLLRLRSGIR
ncbi:MAG: hypothetical protein KDA80_11800 [Planctomycetaceae bacterium]|nr:hypothetical protein [Planctomycetaceae bacterium]